MFSVTVIIPTYNRAPWLPETIASILNQTYPPAEVLIVDDGSTDETEAVCTAFPEPVRYIRQSNAGVSAARNRGVREAKHDWIAFVDSDDVWEPNKLEVQLAAMRSDPGAQWSITGCKIVNPQGREVAGLQSYEGAFHVFRDLGVSADEHFSRSLQCNRVEVEGTEHTVYSGDAFELLFHGNFVLPSTAIVRREALSRAGEFDESLHVAEDTEFFHRLAAVAPVLIVMTPLTRYRVGEGSSLTSQSNTISLIKNALISVERAVHLRPFLSPAGQHAYTSGRQRLLLRLAYTHLSLLNRRSARATLTEARRTGAAISSRWLGIYAASLLPVFCLRGLHALKRSF